MEDKTLACFRVWREGGNLYKAAKMTDEQRLARNSYIRLVLRDYPEWGNMESEELNNIRLYEIHGGYMLEDGNGCDYYLANKKISHEETQFRRARAMMPFEFVDLTGKDFDWGKYQGDVAKQKNDVNRYILNYAQFRDNGMGLYIYSSMKGSGKTMLACCLLNEIAKRYAGSVKFINTLDFLEMTKKGYKGGTDETRPLYDAGLLVIDDIGVQMSKEWVDTVFYRLINSRYTNRKPTIYTSNVEVEGLKMDDRITDRIESTTYLLKLPEESVRRQLMQQEKKRILDQIKNSPCQ